MLPYHSILISYKPKTVIIIVTRLRVRRSGVRIPAGTADFSHLQKVQADPGPHPASYSVVTGGYFLRDKKAEADHLLPSSVEVMKSGAIPPLPLYVFMASVGKTLLFYLYRRRAASSSISEISNTYQEKFSVGLLRRLYGKLPAVVYSVGKTETKINRLAPRIADSETFIQI